MRMSSTIGQRINKFDNLPTNTVQDFNNLFPECPVKDFDLAAELEILEPAPNNSRVLKINGLEVRHKMFANLLYNVDVDVYNMHEKEADEVMGYPV